MPTRKPHFEELINYWQTLPKTNENNVPCKTAFDPMQVAGLLPRLFFCEQMSKYNMHIRLMGETLDLAVGNAVPNRNVYESLPECDWSAAELFYATLSAQPCAGHAARLVSVGNGLFYDMDAVMLPLTDRNCEASFYVGLADTRQNHEKSVQAQFEAVDVTGFSTMEYWDLGYGLPRFEKKAPLERFGLFH